ncbi:LAMI_0G01882g1_1 [Lachancea mirantina]|uniref:LAMI_0G01882g1_1 n=1 Tax=Lachancea mirantina TaxID=1230905 RepID=A0A1G4K7L6_9SACH|nr:LAMI_0G01882g1_1 [Lachancea mirantina]
MTEINGQIVDDESRCIHWHSEVDIICFKLKCCRKFYACYACHENLEDHRIERYDLGKDDDMKERVVLCGKCKNAMTFEEYIGQKPGAGDLNCPFCNSVFNPYCRLHYDKYFEHSSTEL